MDAADSSDLSHQHFIASQAEFHEMQCTVCGRTFIHSIRLNEHLHSITVCRDCKSLVMEDNRNSSRSQRRRRPAYGSSESVDSAFFSQQFSQMIGLARQNRDAQLDDGALVSNHQLSSNGRRARSSHSETDNESIDFMDTLFGETDSHISFGGYGDDSDASVDQNSVTERETQSPLDYESRAHTDTDIDPMHAGIDQWAFDDPSEYVEWEGGGTRDPFNEIMELSRLNRDAPSPNGSTASPQIHWGGHNIDLFTGVDEIDLSPFTGNSGDYMDAQGFEELLERLAEADTLRIGAPPAAASFLQNLPCVIISEDHEKSGASICPICKDSLSVDSEARQLPCSHLYHPSCIIPWLRKRNSCPVCRYELPTDDPKYEEGKRNNARRRWPVVDESYPGGPSDIRDEANESADDTGGGPNRGGNGRWLLIVAAPIAAVIGIVIAAWVRSSRAGGRIQILRAVRDCDGQHSHRSHGGAGAHENRSSSWWSFY